MKTVQIVLKNRNALFYQPVPNEINDILKYRVPGYEYTPGYKYRGWDGFLHLVRKDVVGTGVFLAMKEKLEEEGFSFVVTDQRKPPEFNLKTEIPDKVRPYQKDCLEKMILASKTGGLILNATGTGKSCLAGLYFKSLKGAALFVVDELTLLKQAKDELEQWIGEEVGEIGNSVFNPKRITVGTIQTIHRHRFDKKYVPWTRTLQVIVIDEIHLMLARRNRETVAAIQPPVVFGLTATLEIRKRHVAMKAYELCGPVVFSYPLEKGVEEGYLAKGVAIAVQVENNVAPVKFTGKNWWQRRQFYRQQYPVEYQEIIVEGEKRNETIKELLLEAYKQGKYVVVLVDRIKHIKWLSNEIDEIPHDLILGEKKVEQRVASKARFERGDIRILLSTKIFKKGINLKKVDVIIDGAGMKSKNDTVQKYGRGVRLCDGKKGLIYIDMSDVGNRFAKAALSRRAALKKAGVPIFKVDSELGAEKILELAEKKLESLFFRKEIKS